MEIKNGIILVASIFISATFGYFARVWYEVFVFPVVFLIGWLLTKPWKDVDSLEKQKEKEKPKKVEIKEPEEPKFKEIMVTKEPEAGYMLNTN